MMSIREKVNTIVRALIKLNHLIKATITTEEDNTGQIIKEINPTNEIEVERSKKSNKKAYNLWKI